jgi:hypothetical protein
MVDEKWERLGKLPSKEKGAICLSMSDACVRICADNIRFNNPGISEKEVIERVRERLQWAKEHR